MEETLLKKLSRHARRIARTLRGVTAIAFLIATSGPTWAWQTAHGDPDNSGFADVETAVARAPMATVPRLGGIAPGAGPVVAPDGTVYVANMRGKLMSFRPDGTPGWSRDIGGQAVLSSPALGSDGAIYVVGTAKVRDHTVTPVTTRVVTELYKFNSGGALLWHTPMPKVYGGLSGDAPPNIWRSGGSEAIIVPGIFRQDSAQFEMHLVAFSTNGQVLADTMVSNLFGDVTGSGLPVSDWWMYPCYFITLGHGCGSFGAPQGESVPTEGLLPDNLMNPLAAAAIRLPDYASTPQIVVSDAFHDLVAYTFNGSAFEELYRAHNAERILLGTPMLLNDGHAMIPVRSKDFQTSILFAARGLQDIIVPTSQSFAAPTRMKDGRFAVVRQFGGVAVLRGGLVDAKVDLPGQSIASAAASRNHLFVSTVLGLHTLDPQTLATVASFAWTRGGVNTPVIGPQGHVYAIADDTLFVFGPPLNVTANNTTPPSGPEAGNTGNGGPVLGGGVFQDSGIPAPTGQKTGVFQAEGIPAPTTTGTGGVFQAEESSTAKTRQAISYKPPLSKNGYRLFACLELDGDDCGKKDHREIARQYCVKEGYTESQEFEVETRKGKAETLTGDEYCSKKKCKVFEEITCKM